MKAEPVKLSALAPRRPLWQSVDGESQLFCAPQETFLATLADNSIDCIWTDPPYFLSNNGTTCVAGRRQSVNKGRVGSQPWSGRKSSIQSRLVA